jgi:hypothetical protein
MLPQMANGIFLQPVTTIVTPVPRHHLCLAAAARIKTVLSSYRQ